MLQLDEAQRFYDAKMPARQLRYLRFVELWQTGNWTHKVYLHSAHAEKISDGFLAKSKELVAPQLADISKSHPGYHVGFLILAHGVVSNWVMLNWWSSLHLYQRIFQVEGMPPIRFLDAPPDLFQCVYDLRITDFESEAWRRHMVENPGRDLKSYLEARLDVDV